MVFLFLAPKNPLSHLPSRDNSRSIETIENLNNVLANGDLPVTFSDGWNIENQVQVLIHGGYATDFSQRRLRS